MSHLCGRHSAMLDAAIVDAHLAHLRRKPAEADLLRAIWEEPDSTGPQRVEDFEPIAVAHVHLGMIAHQFDLDGFFDGRMACPACRLRAMDVIGMAAAGVRASYDRLVGGHA